MNELDKPQYLRNLPVDPLEALPELLRRLGPLSELNLKYGLKRKFSKRCVDELLDRGIIYICEEEPVVLYYVNEV